MSASRYPARACHVGLVVVGFVVVAPPNRRRVVLRCLTCAVEISADERNVLEDNVRCPDHDPPAGCDPGAYGRAHANVRRVRNDPADHACVWCGAPAQEWSHDDRQLPDGVTSGGYPYSWNPDHYRPACIRCHRRAPHWRNRTAHGAQPIWRDPNDDHDDASHP